MRLLKRSFVALDEALSNFEDTGAGTLDRLAADYVPDAGLLRHLVELAESGEVKQQIAATALLKRYRERHIVFEANLVVRLLELIPAAQHWEATLHLLQMLPQLPISPGHADSLCDSLRDLTRHRNTFVRAWAYGGLHGLATLYPEYRCGVAPLLKRAAREEAASVRARLRQLPSLDDMPSNA